MYVLCMLCMRWVSLKHSIKQLKGVPVGTMGHSQCCDPVGHMASKNRARHEGLSTKFFRMTSLQETPCFSHEVVMSVGQNESYHSLSHKQDRRSSKRNISWASLTHSIKQLNPSRQHLTESFTFFWGALEKKSG